MKMDACMTFHLWTCQGVASVLRSQNGTACPYCCQEGHADPRFDPRAITLTSYTCWVCLWFFSLYRGLLFFLVSPPFSIHKIQHSNFHFTWKLRLQHYILSGSSGWEHTQCGCPQPNAIFFTICCWGVSLALSLRLYNLHVLMKINLHKSILKCCDEWVFLIDILTVFVFFFAFFP